MWLIELRCGSEVPQTAFCTLLHLAGVKKILISVEPCPHVDQKVYTTHLGHEEYEGET